LPSYSIERRHLEHICTAARLAAGAPLDLLDLLPGGQLVTRLGR
jgi:hypothetical protein